MRRGTRQPFFRDPKRYLPFAAAYSKRRRKDAQVLHPELVNRLVKWLKTKPQLGPDDLLFPISGSVPGGKQRRTAEMMQRDLERARKTWIKEAENEEEQRRREESDFLKYRDAAGHFADFHSHRHTFITALERAGVRPKTAQTLARHSDIRLTMGIYTHIGLHDQTQAIESLPPPPETKKDGGESDAGQTDAA